MEKKPKDRGVLFIRYDKDSYRGQIIERIKQESPKYKLNEKVLDLIFLSEIVELISLNDIDLDIYYESLRLFQSKIEQTNYMIRHHTQQITHQKNRELELSLAKQNLKPH
jgi:hypothetical protein